MFKKMYFEHIFLAGSPAEFSSNPHQTHLNQLKKVFTITWVCLIRAGTEVDHQEHLFRTNVMKSKQKGTYYSKNAGFSFRLLASAQTVLISMCSRAFLKWKHLKQVSSAGLLISAPDSC